LYTNFTRCSIFLGLRPPDSLPGLCPWIPRGTYVPETLARPPPLEPIHCKILGTPMRIIIITAYYYYYYYYYYCSLNIPRAQSRWN